MVFQDHSIEFNMSSSNFSFICSYLIGHLNCSRSYLNMVIVFSSVRGNGNATIHHHMELVFLLFKAANSFGKQFHKFIFFYCSNLE